jgi:hypothetical protein
MSQLKLNLAVKLEMVVAGIERNAEQLVCCNVNATCTHTGAQLWKRNVMAL